jgi:hypothetical protein
MLCCAKLPRITGEKANTMRLIRLRHRCRPFLGFDVSRRPQQQPRRMESRLPLSLLDVECHVRVTSVDC